MRYRPLAVFIALLLCAIGAHAQDYVGITLSTVTAPDPRWFEWSTTTTASWDRPSSYNRYDMMLEVHGECLDVGLPYGEATNGPWVRWDTAPTGRAKMEVPSGCDVRFWLVDTWTGEQYETYIRDRVVVYASFNPPPLGSVWMWTGDKWALRVPRSQVMRIP